MSEQAKVTAEIEAKQAAQSKFNAEILELNTKIQAALQSALEAASTQPSQMPPAKEEVKAAPVTTAAPKPKASPQQQAALVSTAAPTPKAGPQTLAPSSQDNLIPIQGSLGQKTFTTIQEDEEHVAKDRGEQVVEYLEDFKVDDEQAELVFNWPSARRTSNSSAYQNSAISELTEEGFETALQQALNDFCKAQHVPAGHLPYLAPKIKKICYYRPWPEVSTQAIARVAFHTIFDAERLLDSYEVLAKKFVEIKWDEEVGTRDGAKKKVPMKERIYIRLVKEFTRRDNFSDTMSVAASDTSDLSVAQGTPGQKPKKELLLAQGIEPMVWRSRSQKWFAHASVQKSASSVAKAFGLEEPVASYDVPQPAPEGSICLNFVSYEQAKAFKDQINEHPTGVRSGAAHLALHWAKRRQTSAPAPKAKETPSPKDAPKAKAW